ncbi:hypothetical protein LPTSP4_13780 [Leptospira ryugenii]|uniref:Uncharacterized protein n=1 Tax=Leptospira ryugenii TaxID=1917863 RepID=A0A2P2DZ02_9LEPT|nr:hypothetical protein [Leptospira ryugenii]GBF49858.1 hypothetical protein LPTSP4_13780 [Leptospira ryugenii]
MKLSQFLNILSTGQSSIDRQKAQSLASEWKENLNVSEFAFLKQIIESRPYEVLSSLELKRFLCQTFQIPESLFEESKKRTKNSCLTMALLFPPNKYPKDPELNDWKVENLDGLQERIEKKDTFEFVFQKLQRMSEEERYLYLKLILKKNQIPFQFELKRALFEEETLWNLKTYQEKFCKLILGSYKRSSNFANGIEEIHLLAKNQNQWTKVATIQQKLSPGNHWDEVKDYCHEKELEKFGPVRTVSFGLLLHISYMEKIESKRHKAGFFLNGNKILGLQRVESDEEVSFISDL